LNHFTSSDMWIIIRFKRSITAIIGLSSDSKYRCRVRLDPTMIG
jgi:hypothetical protein